MYQGLMQVLFMTFRCIRMSLLWRMLFISLLIWDKGTGQLHNGSAQIPYKKSKKNPLDEESKEYNHALSKIRVKVENVIRSLKIFRILSDRYRNKRKRYEEKFSIIAGIVNMKNGFV